MQKYVKFFCWFFWKFENMFIWHHSSIRKSRVFAQCYNEILMLRNLLGHKICWYSKFFIFLLLQLQGWRKRRITTRHPRFSDLPPSLNWIPVYFGTYMTRCDRYSIFCPINIRKIALHISKVCRWHISFQGLLKVKYLGPGQPLYVAVVHK